MRKPKAVCTVGLIIVNIAVFMVLSLLGDTENGYFMLHHGAMYEPMILENQEYYRFFTCMFLHFGIQHLLNNMVMLGALGWQLEPVIGKVKYLLIYFISGLGECIGRSIRCDFWIDGSITVCCDCQQRKAG